VRIIPLLTLLPLAAAPAAAQGIVVPVRCHGECLSGSLPRTFALDTVKAWANLERGAARTSANHVFRNETADTVDAAFFFPLPADAVVEQVSVWDAARPAHDQHRLLLYNEWSRPDESKWIFEGLMREGRSAVLREYADRVLLHVPVRDVPPGGMRELQVLYSQALRTEDGQIAYRYPLSVGASASPIGHLRLGMEVKTENGFRDIRSTSHAVEMQLGSEPGPCRPRERCGTRGYPSHRVKVVRLQPAPRDRGRDFEVVYTPEEATGERRSAAVP
jgi:Ca-activated chloride channel family protein